MITTKIDFRETAPGASDVWMFKNATSPTASTVGGLGLFIPIPHPHYRVIDHGLAAGVPGELRGWERLHTKYGKLPWAKLFEGAIKLARDGFTVNQDLAANLDDSGRTGYSQLH